MAGKISLWPIGAAITSGRNQREQGLCVKAMSIKSIEMPVDPVIEFVAQEICKRRSGTPWENIGVIGRAGYRAAADAAIKALKKWESGERC